MQSTVKTECSALVAHTTRQTVREIQFESASSKKTRDCGGQRTPQTDTELCGSDWLCWAGRCSRVSIWALASAAFTAVLDAPSGDTNSCVSGRPTDSSSFLSILCQTSLPLAASLMKRLSVERKKVNVRLEEIDSIAYFFLLRSEYHFEGNMITANWRLALEKNAF